MNHGTISRKRYPSILLVVISLASLLPLPGCHFWGIRIEKKIPVRFAYADGNAETVCVAGSFNHWSPHFHCMAKNGNEWSLQLLLPPGRYQYIFVIDDHLWKSDPGASLTEESGFGMKNSVLIVE